MMGWWQMVSMFNEEASTVERPGRPTVCPLSGDLLVSDRDGELVCPWDGERF